MINPILCVIIHSLNSQKGCIFMLTREKEKTVAEHSASGIGLKSFITVVAILTAVLVICGVLSYIVPQGSFQRAEDGTIIVGTYEQGEVEGIAILSIIRIARKHTVDDNILAHQRMDVPRW